MYIDVFDHETFARDSMVQFLLHLFIIIFSSSSSSSDFVGYITFGEGENEEAGEVGIIFTRYSACLFVGNIAGGSID